MWLLWLLLAQSPQAPATQNHDPIFEDQVVVSANRDETKAHSVPAQVTVLEREDLEASPETTLDGLLRQVPGFSLFRRAGSRVAHPTTQGASLRGLGPNGAGRTLVLLDGVPLNDPFGGWVYWSRVPTGYLQKIEVLRGGASDLWGSSALAGVIHLLTAAPTRAELGLGLEAGERREGKLSFSAGRPGRFLDLRLFDTGGYFVLDADQRGAIDIPATSQHASTLAKVLTSVGQRATVQTQANLFAEERGNGTPLTGNRTQGAFLGTSLAWQQRGAWEMRLQAFRQDFDNRFSAQAADRDSERPALDQFDVTADALRQELNWTGKLFGEGQASAGQSLAWTDAGTAESFFFVGEVGSGDFSRQRRAGGRQLQGGAFLQQRVGLTPRLDLTLGARLDLWRQENGRRLERVIADGTALLDQRFEDRERTRFSPRAGLLWRPNEQSRLYLSAYRAFRAPTINELYRPFRVRNTITAANADLEPETLEGYEAGFSWRSRGLSANLNLFDHRLSRAIANLTLGPGPGQVPPCGFVPSGGLCRQRGNLIASEGQGLEAELAYRGKLWSLRLAHLRTDAEVRAENAAVDGRRPPQVPKESWTLALDFGQLKYLAARIELRREGRRFEDDRNTLVLPAFTVAGLSLRHDLYLGAGRRGQLLLAVENLGDATFAAAQSAEGLTTIGAPRLARLGLRLSWGGS